MVINLYYYSYKPRLRLYATVDIPEPLYGDKIIIPKKWFLEIGKEFKKSDNFNMRVIGRTINCVYYKGPTLNIELELEKYE